MSLKAEHISFRYHNGNRSILNDFQIELLPTDRTGIIAPSGFGKTTCCKILAGYEAPASGEVLIDGVPLPNIKGYCPVQMIWQHPELAVNPRLRMKDILKEGGAVEPQMLKRLGIREEWLNRFPTELSGGELQRFCIARALGKDTKYLLADEISTMLDLVTQSEIWNFLLEEVERRNIGLLVVSHSESLLQRVCTKVITLSERG